MDLSPGQTDRRTPRSITSWALVLGLGLAGLLVGCGEGGGSSAGSAQPGAGKETEQAKKQSRQEQMQKLKGQNKPGRPRL